VTALTETERERELISRYAERLEEISQPAVLVQSAAAPDRAAIETSAGYSRFDLIMGRDVLSSAEDKADRLASWILAFPEARLVLAESSATEGGRLSRLPDLMEAAGKDLASRFSAFEEEFYSACRLPSLSWKSADAATWLEKAGCKDGTAETEKRTWIESSRKENSRPGFGLLALRARLGGTFLEPERATIRKPSPEPRCAAEFPGRSR
jgi:hypothetical protein